MSLKDLLVNNGVRRALIVDDVFDSMPTANDIDPANDAWPIFIDDLQEQHRNMLQEEYPQAAERSFDELITDDGYVAAIWNLREEFGAICDPLFATYIGDQQSDQQYMEQAVEKLKALGLECTTSGRDFIGYVGSADLILIDLFLNKTQDDLALNESKSKLCQALGERRDNPPLVVLMSRSNRLEAKRDEFRDDVGLLDSAFRIIKKAELGTSDHLERQLERLAQNAVDSRKLASFFYALERGMAEATNSTLKLLRNLRLSDIGQIQQLLLSAEGEPIGSYLVDVFDGVLQHEIERDSGIIDAAVDLNHFSAACHPTPYVAGSPSLQELVERLLSQNNHRLKLAGTLEAPVAFGDILKITANANIANLKAALLVDLTPDNVLLVLTPACDLQRGGVPRILLLVGSVKPLNVQNWSYRDDARTPVIRLDNELRWIKWDLKHIDTVSYGQLNYVLEENDLVVAARLREAHALELQQRVLSGLGRVGTIATLPATFTVDVEVYYPNSEGIPTRLDIQALAEGAVCFVGRDSKSDPIVRLIMTDHCSDNVLDTFFALEEDKIAERAKIAFSHVRTSEDLRKMLVEGIDLKNVTDSRWSYIPSFTNNPQVPKIGLIAWNFGQFANALGNKDLAKAGIIILIKDRIQDESTGFNVVVRSGLVSPDDDTE